jgi:hypothetical protein
VTWLDAAMRVAHRDGDVLALIGLCELAAEGPAEAFWLTQAWIHALEAGDARAEKLRGRLRAMGAE